MKLSILTAALLVSLPLVAQQKPTPMPKEPSKANVMTADEIDTMAASISVAKRFCNSGPKLQLARVLIYDPETHTWLDQVTCHDAEAEGLFSLEYPDFIDEYKHDIDAIAMLTRQLDILNTTIQKAVTNAVK
jgi:hypothetical protein